MVGAIPAASISAILSSSVEHRFPKALDRVEELLASCSAEDRKSNEAVQPLADWCEAGIAPFR
jgi:hypothetical protein